MPRKAIGVVPLLALLFVLALPDSTISGAASPAANVAQLFSGRDVYSPDVLPDPGGNGYITWYGGWQTKQIVDSGQFDTIYRRTAPPQWAVVGPHHRDHCLPGVPANN